MIKLLVIASELVFSNRGRPGYFTLSPSVALIPNRRRLWVPNAKSKTYGSERAHSQ